MDQKYHYHHFILTLLPLIIVFIWINSSLVDCQAYNGPISRQVEVFVNVYDHPKTGFSCQGKNPGQYYADPATKCAVYYVCIPNPTGTMSAQSFACPNGTIFSQATRVCRPHEEVFCPLAARYYDSIDGSIDNRGEHVDLPTLPELSKPVAAPHRPQKSSSNKPPKSLPIISSLSDNKPIPKLASAPTSSSSSHHNSFNINRNFRNSRTFSTTSTTTSTTTTTTPRPSLPPQPLQPTDLGVADYEYDYSDYNETGLVNAAATLLQSTILNQQPNKDSITNMAINQSGNDHEDDDTSDRRRRRRKRNISLQKQRKEEHMNHKLTESLLAERTKSSESFLVPTEIFSCEDKIHGLAYADLTNDCQKFFVCLSFSKGKMMAYRFDCEQGKRFNQQKGGCDTKIDTKTCQRNSQHYFIYNKWFKQSKKHLLNKSI
ncbi:uncharacterized protein LOC124499095 [Dermatophagoides farinae]|uniref:uncharacterized protein LOC124499095 n=1 Tax=Dermatophagoides farinae TaxID=6954 RepID=UPI003F644BFF